MAIFKIPILMIFRSSMHISSDDDRHVCGKNTFNGSYLLNIFVAIFHDHKLINSVNGNFIIIVLKHGSSNIKTT